VASAARGTGGFGPFGAGPFDDIFDLFFGREAPSGGEPGPERGRDLGIALEVTLEEAARGAERTIQITREETCPACFGTGAEKGSAPETCPTCRGVGQVQHSRRTAFGAFTQIATCPQCGGRTKVVRHPCRDCRGSGRANADREISVKIPSGVEDGTRLRLAGEGEAGMRGGERGDLYVDLAIAAHPVFTRRGRDLHCEVSVSIVQAALGDQVEVPTLGGPESVPVPPGVQPGSTMTLRGKGMPGLRDGHGDLVVHFNVVVPKDLTKEQERALLEFARLRGEHVSPAKKTLLGKLRPRVS